MKKLSLFPGEEQAWSLLEKLEPNKVEKNADVTFDRELTAYVLRCFGQVVRVSLESRDISSSSQLGKILVDNLIGFSKPSILLYLSHAKDLPLSGRLLKPSDLPGGEIFVQGSHVLPLDKIADCFGNDSQEFYNKGKELGGTRLEHGDMALKLAPFPRLQFVLIVRSGDEEFPPNASLLLDSSCTFHVATDIIWAISELTIRLMLV